MLYLIIGAILLMIAAGIYKKEGKNPLSYAAMLVLIFFGLTLAYQDIYFDLVVRNNVKDFYNDGYGTLFYTYSSFYDNVSNTTNTTTAYHYYYGANDTIALEYFARQQAEYNYMPTFYALMPIMIGILIFYVFYKNYKAGIGSIIEKDKEAGSK